MRDVLTISATVAALFWLGYAATTLPMYIQP